MAVVIVIAMAFFGSDYLSLNSSNDTPLFNPEQTGKIITIDAIVLNILADDLIGSRHQKMILQVGNKTVLLAHNIDVAPRIPVKKGAKIRVHGQYEWNKKGGIIHWTHKDKKNRHPHGWVEYNNKRYQ